MKIIRKIRKMPLTTFSIKKNASSLVTLNITGKIKRRMTKYNKKKERSYASFSVYGVVLSCVTFSLLGYFLTSLYLQRFDRKEPIAIPYKDDSPNVANITQNYVEESSLFSYKLLKDNEPERKFFPKPGSTWDWPSTEAFLSRMSKRHLSKKVFVVTPTARKPSQVADLVRLAQLLYPVRHLVIWQIYEDATKIRWVHPSQVWFLRRELRYFKKTYGMDIRVNWSKMRPKSVRLVNWQEPKGVEARTTALDYIRDVDNGDEVLDFVFFADDDNTYDVDVFRQMLQTEKVSCWPVALVTPETRISTPLIDPKTKKFIDFFDGFKVNRLFPIDFGGFAVNANLIIAMPNATIPYIAGYEESGLLKMLGIKFSDLKMLANGGTEVLAYHTRTTYAKHKYTRQDFKRLQPSSELENTNVADLFKNYFWDLIIPFNNGTPTTTTTATPKKVFVPYRKNPKLNALIETQTEDDLLFEADA